MQSQLLWRRAAVLAGVLLVTGCGDKAEDAKEAVSASVPDRATQNEVPVNLTQRARSMLQAGDLDSAAESAYQALVQDPNNGDATLVASRIEAARGNHQASVDLASSIDMQSRLGQRAAEVHAQQLLKLNQLSEAADVILASLDRAPEGDSRSIPLRRDAWQLLSRVGRRLEASWQADILCRAGKANQLQMLSLARRNEAFPFALETGGKPEDQFEPGLGIARWHFTQHEYRRALQELSGQAEAEFESPAACALYGRLLAETQSHETFSDWHAKCDAKAAELSDYWVALGIYFFDQHQFEASARALLEAATRDPTDFSCVNRLGRVFEALGQSEESEQFRHRGALIYQVEFAATDTEPGDASASEGLLRLLLELGRPFEAIGWTLLRLPASDVNRRAAVSQKLTQLSRDRNAVMMSREMALVGVDPSRYSLEPALSMLRQSAPAKSSTARASTAKPSEQFATPRLENVASEVGLDFQWYQDIEHGLSLIPLHELMGGGIAVADYDRDGWPDVYVAQGSGEPPSDSCSRSNVLFRNVASQFEAVTEAAAASDFNYGSGLAVGDVNQDGFADLYIGSLGRNRLLINNGDGTFRDATGVWGSIEERFTSSLAIADINGDDMPDLFEAVYVEMEGGFEPPEIAEDGVPIQPAPVEHYAQSDRWFENMGDGTFQLREIPREVADPGTSLGVVVTDFDGNGSNEIFVGNDARTNHFLVPKGENQFVNAAGVKGIASGFSGEADACMGIATGDFDRNGSLDMHIANYAKESANHYLQTSKGEFTDLAIRYGIDQFTLPYIGFGTKAVDVDRNGWLDLMVTNGHVFDLRADGQEFKMPPQFLSNLGDRFEMTAVEDRSGYWEGTYLGRTIAMTDFDRDGAIDFLVGHLHAPLALLHNQTDASRGHWIQVELVGTASERDAIGARVQVKMEDGRQFTQWITAGDGYLCSDEPVIDFGLGEGGNVKSLELDWPHGEKQVFDNLLAEHRYLIVEGNPEPYMLVRDTVPTPNETAMLDLHE
ncbi:MAG: FG-GAP-like repeat-containing protein [Rubripirellula sp.]